MKLCGKFGLVFACFAACVSSVFVTRFFQFQTDHVRPADLFRVIDRQVKAVRRDNYSKAYEEGSGAFQRKFNFAQFIRVAKSDYAPIAKAVSVEIGSVETKSDCALIRVYFTDHLGKVVPCLYTLVNEGDSWKIEDARVLPGLPRGSHLSGVRL